MARKSYRKSRPDYPDGVIGIYDEGDGFERYLVCYAPWTMPDWPFTIWPYVSLSETGRTGLYSGINYHGESDHRIGSGAYSGKGAVRRKTLNWSNLPEDCRAAVLADMEP